MGNVIFLAIDTTNISNAQYLIEETKDYLAGIKLGMEFFYSNGITGINRLATFGLPIFLDLKMYDIPTTMGNSVSALQEAKWDYLSIHLANHTEAILAAKENLLDNRQLIGITTLSSDERLEIKSIQAHLCYAVVLDIKNIVLPGPLLSKIEFHGLTIFTPGISMWAKGHNDQYWNSTPVQAYKSGADYLVIGRSITKAPFPKDAAKFIHNAINKHIK